MVPELFSFKLRDIIFHELKKGDICSTASLTLSAGKFTEYEKKPSGPLWLALMVILTFWGCPGVTVMVLLPVAAAYSVPFIVT
jgi:hypothetical protein